VEAVTCPWGFEFESHAPVGRFLEVSMGFLNQFWVQRQLLNRFGSETATAQIYMAGLAIFNQNIQPKQPRPSTPPSKSCFSRRKNELLDPLPSEVTGFCIYREVTSSPTYRTNQKRFFE
jgi:hypothetical protein